MIKIKKTNKTIIINKMIKIKSNKNLIAIALKANVVKGLRNLKIKKIC
jgi:hypothetical protein